MVSFALRRLLLLIPVLLVASVAIFLLIHLVPGDPALIVAGPDASAEQIEHVRKQFGLDQPLPIQYFFWLLQILQGNAGESFISGRPATELILTRLPATATLAVSGLILALCVALVLGLLAAYRAGRFTDWLISSGAGVSDALPNFWLGILLILIFSVNLKVLPPGGYVPFDDDPGLAVRSLVLPAITLAVAQAATFTRYLRASALDALQEDYVRTAVSKGMSPAGITWRHVLPNSLVPMLTIVGIQFGHLLGGAVVVETVFAWPGIGSLLIQSIGNRDYPVIQGTLLLLVMMFVIVNLLTDILYGLVDPRIRAGLGQR